MPRIKSLLTPVQIGIVQRAHDCQGNSNHRLNKGDRRLEVKKERGWDYYCLECGEKMLQRDADAIQKNLNLCRDAMPINKLKAD